MALRLDESAEEKAIRETPTDRRLRKLNRLLTNERLQELAKTRKPPEWWFDTDEECPFDRSNTITSSGTSKVDMRIAGGDSVHSWEIE